MNGNSVSPLISVIVPVYNVEGYLEECIQSVLDQTYPNWELILVDDGSTDRSGEICDQYREKDRRISVRHTANLGVSHARNLGLELAGGEWISFLDSDDFFSPHALEVLLRYSDGVDVVASGGRGYPAVRSFPSLSAMGNDFIPFFMFVHNSCWNKLYRKERLAARFDEQLRCGSDLYFFFEQLQQCRGIRVIPDCLVYYRKDYNMNSLSHRFRMHRAKAGIDAYEYLLSIFPESQEIHQFGLRYFIADFTCECISTLSRARCIDEPVKVVLVEEMIREPIYEEAGKRGILPYHDLYSGIWEAVLRHDAAAALERAQTLGKNMSLKSGTPAGT